MAGELGGNGAAENAVAQLAMAEHCSETGAPGRALNRPPQSICASKQVAETTVR